jgi:hypothetical protein
MEAPTQPSPEDADMKTMLVRELEALTALLDGTDKDTGATEKLIGLIVTASESGKQAERFMLALRPSAAAALLQNLQVALSAVSGTDTPGPRH